jgi:serine protease inhibitor ecotin
MVSFFVLENTMKILTITAVICFFSTPVIARNIEPDLKTFPVANADETRWVIQLPKLENESSHKVELTFVKVVETDCNKWTLTADLEEKTIESLGYVYYKLFSKAVPLTRVLCPSNNRRHVTNISVVKSIKTLPYSSSLPLVIYTEKSLGVNYQVVTSSEMSRCYDRIRILPSRLTNSSRKLLGASDEVN